MGMFDAQHVFSDSQDMTDDAASTNYFDFGAQADWAPGERLAVRIHIDEAIATCDSITFAVQTDAASSFDTGPTTLSNMTVLTAALTAGSVHEMVVPAPTDRYLRMYYTVNGTNASAGEITAYLVQATAPQTNMA